MDYYDEMREEVSKCKTRDELTKYIEEVEAHEYLLSLMWYRRDMHVFL